MCGVFNGILDDFLQKYKRKNCLFGMSFNRKKSALINAIVLAISILVVIFVVVDLYEPIKSSVVVDDMNFKEIIAAVKLEQPIPIIVAVSIAMAFNSISNLSLRQQQVESSENSQ
jgi:wobble nucleotide-excising tRNase